MLPTRLVTNHGSMRLSAVASNDGKNHRKVGTVYSFSCLYESQAPFTSPPAVVSITPGIPCHLHQDLPLS